MTRSQTEPGHVAIWLPLLLVSLFALIFSSAIAMASMGAFAVWTGGVAVFYALHGGQVVRRCAFPLAFLAMAIPLPYSLSMTANAALREFVAEQAVDFGAGIGLDAAIEHGAIIIGPYVLAIENACTGANSTLSLVAISVLYAYWVRSRSILSAGVIAALAIPIAMAANIGRVVGLMALVDWRGSSVLSTFLHPLSGFVSFTIAVGLLLALDHSARRLRRGMPA